MCRYRQQLLPKRGRLSTRCNGRAGVVRLLTRRHSVSAPISFGKVYPTATPASTSIANVWRTSFARASRLRGPRRSERPQGGVRCRDRLDATAGKSSAPPLGSFQVWPPPGRRQRSKAHCALPLPNGLVFSTLIAFVRLTSISV